MPPSLPFDLASLRTFQAVAQDRSVSRAARRLGVTTPTVSVAIRNLEANLGTTLFLRTSLGVELTPTGRALLDRSERVFSLVDDAFQAVRSLESEDVGTFTLGCYESLGAYFLPDFLAAFLPSAPGITLSLYNGTSANVRERVIDRSVDFGLVVNCAPHDDLARVDLYGDEVEVVALAPATSLDDAHGQLRRGPLIWCDRPVFAALAAELREVAPPRSELVCGDLELVKSLLRHGIGVGILPRRVGDYGGPPALVPLHPELPARHDRIHLVWRGDVHRTRGARTLKDALLRHGRTLADAPHAGAEPPRRR